MSDIYEEEANDVMDIGDVQMTNQKEVSKAERSVVLFGTKHKNNFFRQLCSAAHKYEKHVHYNDVHYLTVEHLDSNHVIELTDPGLARTGGREMAIKKADFVILYYSSMSIESLDALQNLVPSLSIRQNMPILIVCDSEKIVLEERGSPNTSTSSKDGESSDGIKRHYSMEQIRNGLDDNNSAIDQYFPGEKLSEELGTRCSYLKIRSSNKDDAKKILTQMIFTMNKTSASGGRRKSIIKEILKSRSTDKAGDFEISYEKKNAKNKKNIEESKVCVLM